MKNLFAAFIGILFLSSLSSNLVDSANEAVVCVQVPYSAACQIKRRRYDISHMGRENYYHGWADVQGLGAANDYCRIVGSDKKLLLTCALAGTHGESERNFNSSYGFDVGFKHTWYMKDEDGDGRDDYCRCVGSETNPIAQNITCTKAGPRGFFGSPEQGGNEYTFSPYPQTNCKGLRLSSEFGRSKTAN